MINKPLDAITYDDLRELQENRVRENISLEYKQALTVNGNEDKKEFLRDVIALANTVGGDMLFGVTEQRDQDGHPTGEIGSIDGVTIDNYDALTLRLENMIRDSIAPRLVGTAFKQVATPGGLDILIIRTPQSLAGPHMLTMQTRSPFYKRNNGGKFELDVHQIKDAFLQTDALERQFEAFRYERVANINAGTSPVPLLPGPKLLVHTLPLTGIRSQYQIDPQQAANHIHELYPPGAIGANVRYNFDGYLVFDQMAPGADVTARAYTQAFRNGFLEYVTVDISRERELFGQIIERNTIIAVRNHLTLLRNLGVNTSVFALISLLGLNNHQFGEVKTVGWRTGLLNSRIEKQQILLPQIFIESMDSLPDPLLKPAFDVMWQASGLEGSPFYNEDGSRKARV